MRFLRPLLLAVLACLPAATQGVTLNFSAPVHLPAAGQYADAAFRLAGDTLVLQAAPLPPGGARFAASPDLGGSWAAVTAGSCAARLAAGALEGTPIRLPDGSLRGFGELLPDAREPPGTAWVAGNATLLAAAPGGGVACQVLAGEVSFRGLPRRSACGPTPAFGCPFRLGGNGLARLAGGSYVATAMVFTSAPDAKGVVPSSIVAFASPDGARFTYAGTVADAAAFPASQEGPNENALALLSDGATLACVLRTDAGDGPLSHPYAPYSLALSRDGGAHWEQRGQLAGAGAARPRLLHLGAAPAGGVAAPAPLLLAGGRLRDAAAGAAGWDVDLWVNAAGDAQPGAWRRTSLSAAHNALAPAPLRFSPAVNDSAAPRQCTSYTSLLELDGGAAAGARARRIGVTYNRNLNASLDYFMMAFDVSF